LLKKSDEQMTDSEVIAYLIDELLQQGMSLSDSIKSVCEKRLQGTWRLAILGTEKLYIATNSGDFFVGRRDGCLIFCSEVSITDELASLNFEKI
jgi:glucosamine 6-phosphate synthetase-like amidotransferase/phosphosugar isomerase protein